MSSSILFLDTVGKEYCLDFCIRLIISFMNSLFLAFLRGLLLRRQPKLNRTPKNGTKSIPGKIRGTSPGSLDIILEEVPGSMNFEARTPTTRAQRRCALNSIPKELRTALEDISEETLPPKSFDFPVSPLPTSPALSTSPSLSTSPCKSPSLMTSSLPSSPESHKSALPLTPSSSVDELPLPSPALKPKRLATVKPLFNKLDRSSLPVTELQEESDSEDSDSEWYTREFSTLVSVHPSSQPMPLPAAHRDSISVAPSDSPFSSWRRHRRFSSIDGSPQPAPPIPLKFCPAKCAKTLSITAPRRPPPRMSIPDDACSAFSLSLYTDDILDAPPSPFSAYSPLSARMTVCKDLNEDVEFPGEFDIQVDYPLMLPFSLPGSPIDPEVDIVNGLEELYLQMESVSPVSLPGKGLDVGFILEEADCVEEVRLSPEIVTPRIIFTSPPPSPTAHVCTSVPPSSPAAMPSLSPPPRPRRCSTISNLSSISFPPSPLIPRHDLPAEDTAQDDDFDERRFGLKSKWSSSSISSLYEEHSFSSSKFPSASKLKTYFQGQHKRSANKAKRKSKKEAKKLKDESDISEPEVLVIGYSNAPSPATSFHHSPSCPPTSPRSSWDRTSISPVLSSHRSHDMRDILPVASPSPLHSSLYHGHVRSPSQGSATSDSGSDSSSASAGSNSSNSHGMRSRRKPIPLEILLRNGV